MSATSHEVSAPNNTEALRPPRLSSEEAAYLLSRGPYIARVRAQERLLETAHGHQVHEGYEGPNLPDYVFEEVQSALDDRQAELVAFELLNPTPSIEAVLPDTTPVRDRRVMSTLNKLGVPYDDEMGIGKHMQDIRSAVDLVCAVAASADDYARFPKRAQAISGLFERYLAGVPVGELAHDASVEKVTFHNSLNALLHDCRRVLDDSGYWTTGLEDSDDLLDRISTTYCELKPKQIRYQVARKAGGVATARTVERPISSPPRELFLLSDDKAGDWQERGLCMQTDPEAFYPEKGGSTREAKKVCQSCEVREDCLNAALQNDERFGIWGGLSERERRKLKRSLV